jgi:hypothetical protein
MVECVAHDGSYALVLETLLCKKLHAGVKGYAQGGVVGIELHDMLDNRIREVEACAAGEVGTKIFVGVDDTVRRRVVGTFIRVGTVEVGDMSETA